MLPPRPAHPGPLREARTQRVMAAGRALPCNLQHDRAIPEQATGFGFLLLPQPDSQARGALHGSPHRRPGAGTARQARRHPPAAVSAASRPLRGRG